jgi:hypothetical protein
MVDTDERVLLDKGGDARRIYCEDQQHLKDSSISSRSATANIKNIQATVQLIT